MLLFTAIFGIIPAALQRQAGPNAHCVHTLGMVW